MIPSSGGLQAGVPSPANAVMPDRSASVPQNTNPADPIANEISLLRKSLQTLNTRLQAISEELLAPATQDDNSNEKVKRIATNLDLLMHTEERAEVLRKQLIELIEKETSLRSRLVQIDEDMRPESIERALNPYGTTRTSELRDARRRVLTPPACGLRGARVATAASPAPSAAVSGPSARSATLPTSQALSSPAQTPAATPSGRRVSCHRETWRSTRDLVRDTNGHFG